MSSYIALDWEKTCLTGLCGAIAKDRIRVRKFFELDWPTELDRTEEIEKAGQWLRTQLERLDIAERKVMVSLPREEVVVRQLDVPDVSESELPDLVRLQAETKSATSLDTLVLDFLPLPKAHEGAGRQVLMVTVPKEKIEQIRGLLSAADLELDSVGISPVGAAELVARAEQRGANGGDDTTLMVAVHGKRLEISLLRRGFLLSTHAAQLSGEDTEQNSRAALAEIRRFLGALARLEVHSAVSRAWVIGTDEETGALRKLMSQHLSCNVETLDPLDDPAISQDRAQAPADHAPLVGPLGMLLGASGGLVPSVDFVNPRKAVVRPDRRRLYLAVAASVLGLAVVGFYGWTRYEAYSIRAAAAAIRASVASTNEQITKAAPVTKAAQKIRDWERQKVNWLGKMRELSEILGDTSRVYITNVDFTAPGGPGTEGKIVATGFAREKQDVENLALKIDSRGYRSNPTYLPGKDSKENVDKDYPTQFQVEIVAVPEGPPSATPTRVAVRR